ncbi:MAG: tetratricopeptide repeat protein [Capsulimonadaceae bacterium]
MNNTAAEDMSDRIQKLLVDAGFAATAVEAYGQYQRMFVCVLKTLSQPGLKRLLISTRTRTLNAPPDEAGQRFFDEFIGEMGLLSKKLTFLQSQVARQGTMITAVLEQIARLRDVGQVQSLSLSTPLPVFEFPPTGPNIIARSLTVDGLKAALDSLSWLAITGGIGVGKSHLALLIAARFGKCPAWLRFRDQGSGQSAATIDSVFVYLNEGRLPGSPRQLFSDVCNGLGAGSVLVLDDLPVIQTGDAIAQRLEFLLASCRESGVKLITTSAHRLPGLLTRTADGVVREIDAPLLSDLDALELLQAFGAPDSIYADSKRVRFLNALSAMHPALLTAVILYLRDNGWQLSERQLGALFERGYAEEVNESTIRRLVDTVPDAESRELLYRLTLVDGSFDRETVRLLADVGPPVPRPTERLVGLTGLWVQRDSATSFSVSPLIRLVGSGDVPMDVRMKCQSGMARRIMSRGRLSPTTHLTVMTYLAAAGEHDVAVMLQIQALIGLQKAVVGGEISARQADRTGVADLYWETELPTSVPLQFAIILRSIQVGAAKRLKKDAAIAKKDLLEKVESATHQELGGMLAAAVFAASELAQDDFDASCRLLERAAKVLTDGNPPEDTPINLPGEMSAGSLLWLNFIGVNSKDTALRWCGMLRNAPEKLRNETLGTEEFLEFFLPFFSEPYWLTDDTQPLPSDWERVLHDADDVIEAARSAGVEFMETCAQRAKIIILCEHLKRPDDAIRIAMSSQLDPPGDARFSYLIYDAIGYQLSFIPGMEDQARAWLLSAQAVAERKPGTLRLKRAETSLALARLSEQRGDSEEAVCVVSQAVEVTRSIVSLPEMELIKMLGDLSIAEWLNGNRGAAFRAIDEAVVRLIGMPLRSHQLKAIFVLLGHTAGYMASVARYAAPSRIDSGEPLALPPLGVFHKMQVDNLARYYGSRSAQLLPSVMAQFSRAVHADERVGYWTQQLITAARGLPDIAAVVAYNLISVLPNIAMDGRLSELFDGARDAAFVSVASWVQYQRTGTDPLLRSVDVAAVLGVFGGPDWTEAEQRALTFVLLPLAIYLADLAVRARRDAAARVTLEGQRKVAISLCHETAACSSLGNSWAEAAYLIGTSVTDGAQVQELMSRVNLSEETALKTLGYITLSAQERMGLADACKLQMASLPYLLKSLTQADAERLLVLPFVRRFWSDACEDRSSSFTASAAVRQELSEAITLPDGEQAMRIMDVVARGLGVRYEQAVASGFRLWEESKSSMQAS